MEEEWKDVIGFEGFYQVSSFGRVKSLDKTIQYITRWGSVATRKFNGKMLCTTNQNGYRMLTLSCQKHRRNSITVHRLVAEAFIPNPENKQQVNHRDSKKDNNHVDNLEWVTPMENTRHAFENNLVPIGEDAIYSKLKEKDVLYIIDQIKNHHYRGIHRDLAKKFNIKMSTITLIKTGKNWKHLNINFYDND